MRRDTQKSKVYTAERALHAINPAFKTWAEVEAYVKKVVKSAYLQRKYEKRAYRIGNLHVFKGRGGGFASDGKIVYHGWGEYERFYGPQITLGVWARRESVILHEIAHHLVGFGHGHDWAFCEVYLDLVRHFMGKEAHALLKESYRKNKVRFTKPYKRAPLTPEQKAAACERLAKAREARAAKLDTRCTSRFVDGSKSWRCCEDAGHDGPHYSSSGHVKWLRGEEDAEHAA